jgi:branched-subunit amino acid ABC-type transport system permease component
MLASILASGLAVGAVYALIGITYNTMFATSRVMSFTAGQLGMLGGVLGSMFILKLGLPLWLGFLAMLVARDQADVFERFIRLAADLQVWCSRRGRRHEQGEAEAQRGHFNRRDGNHHRAGLAEHDRGSTL